MKENNEKFKWTWNKEKLKYREIEINRKKGKGFILEIVREYEIVWKLFYLWFIQVVCAHFLKHPIENTFRLVSEDWKSEKGELEHTLLSSEARWVRVVRGDGGEGRRQQKKFDKLDAAEGWISRDVCSPSFGSCLYSNTVVHQVKDAIE